jgi:hypothetical protein
MTDSAARLISSVGAPLIDGGRRSDEKRPRVLAWLTAGSTLRGSNRSAMTFPAARPLNAGIAAPYVEEAHPLGGVSAAGG